MLMGVELARSGSCVDIDNVVGTIREALEVECNA